MVAKIEGHPGGSGSFGTGKPRSKLSDLFVLRFLTTQRDKKNESFCSCLPFSENPKVLNMKQSSRSEPSRRLESVDYSKACLVVDKRRKQNLIGMNSRARNNIPIKHSDAENMRVHGHRG